MTPSVLASAVRVIACGAAALSITSCSQSALKADICVVVSAKMGELSQMDVASLVVLLDKALLPLGVYKDDSNSPVVGYTIFEPYFSEVTLFKVMLRGGVQIAHFSVSQTGPLKTEFERLIHELEETYSISICNDENVPVIYGYEHIRRN